MEQISSPANTVVTQPAPKVQAKDQPQADKVKSTGPSARAAEVSSVNSRVAQTAYVTRSEAQRATAAAKSAATSVLSSLTSARTQLASSGPADAERLIREINSIVQTAGFGGSSFIGSSIDRVRVRNGDLGGGVSLETLPMDAEGLGLIDLAASIQAGGLGPAHMLDTAVALAADRAGTLEKRHRALSSGIADKGADTPASTLAAHASSAAEARGMMVDLAT
jgi:hypothetical protein